MAVMFVVLIIISIKCLIGVQKWAKGFYQYVSFLSFCSKLLK